MWRSSLGVFCFDAALAFGVLPLYIIDVSVLESIIHDLRGLPLRKLVDAARYVHGLSESAERERAEALRETHGYLNEKEGLMFERALETSRQVEARA